MKNWEKDVLPDVCGKYGAPMGRRNLWPEDRNERIKLHLRRMRMVGLDYDCGGAYHGGAQPGEWHNILWVAWGYTDNKTLVRVITRGWPRAGVKKTILRDLPNARFCR